MTSTASAPVAGVDVGGTWTVAVVVDPAGREVGRARLPTDAGIGGRLLEGAVEAVHRALDGIAPRELAAVGVGMPGQVDPATGTVRLAMNLRIDSDGLRVAPALERRLGVPVVLENDVRAAALGAFHHLRDTLEPGLRNLAYLSIGTGISSGVVLDGRLYRGRQGMAGEIGHVVVAEDGPVCTCGLRGCLEAVAAGPALQRMWPTEDGRPAEAMLLAAASGDPTANDKTEEVIGRYVLSIQWLAATWEPDLIALGGGIGTIGDPLLSRIRERLAHRASSSDLAGRVLPPDLVVAMPADLPVGAIGVATLARLGSTALGDGWTDVGSAAPSGRGD